LTKSSYAIDQNKYRSTVDLNKYTLILVNGNYFLRSFKNRAMDTKWRNFDCLSRCNQMVTTQQISFLKLASWRQGHFIRAIGRYKGAQEIAGAIFETQLDLSHPINFGMPKTQCQF
jgi:hypothetical protein